MRSSEVCLFLSASLKRCFNVDFLAGEGESPSVDAPSVEKEQTTTAPATTSTRGGQRGRAGPASRGGRYYQRGGAGKAAPREGEVEEGAARDGKRSEYW